VAVDSFFGIRKWLHAWLACTQLGGATSTSPANDDSDQSDGRRYYAAPATKFKRRYAASDAETPLRNSAIGKTNDRNIVKLISKTESGIAAKQRNNWKTCRPDDFSNDHIIAGVWAPCWRSIMKVQRIIIVGTE